MFSSNGQGGQQLEELKDDAHVAAAPHSHLALAHAVIDSLSPTTPRRSWEVNAGDHVDQGGFAAAGFAHDGA